MQTLKALVGLLSDRHLNSGRSGRCSDPASSSPMQNCHVVILWCLWQIGKGCYGFLMGF